CSRFPVTSCHGQASCMAKCSVDSVNFISVKMVYYAFDHRKFGGNAQSITKDRWVHHTSFLWDYDVKNMSYLKNPQRAPEYRQARDHSDFLCRMNEYMPSRSVFTEGITAALGEHFTVQHTELEMALSDHDDFVPSTKVLSPQDLQDIISSKEAPTVERVQGWPR
uniref:BPL/LPL catalytic domain-containing protein n=1 Tax=Aegilops tauschii subsp. strangulata TaxID=200361 RepID=A0A453D6T4_AEGTS